MVELERGERTLLANAVKARDCLKKREARNKQGHSASPDGKHDTGARTSTLHSNLPEGHPVLPTTSAGVSCPFAAPSTVHKPELHNVCTEASLPRRPDSPPTPPGTSRHFEDERGKATAAKDHTPPQSITGSRSKCPIRMLDERPAEEIAEYFEEHKHEIPRSHEVCVKRYQSNAQSIRQLDAKYGNLVNMIQGLGMKHQSFLPTKEAEEQAPTKPLSNHSVEHWADEITSRVGGQIPSGINGAEGEEREAHFDRPLREIRVGESPSRPWGISVPDLEPTVENVSRAPSMISNESGRHFASARASDTPIMPLPGHAKIPKPGKPQMLFTGPVFIGYSPEQAATLVRQLGASGQCKNA